MTDKELNDYVDKQLDLIESKYKADYQAALDELEEIKRRVYTKRGTNFNMLVRLMIVCIAGTIVSYFAGSSIALTFCITSTTWIMLWVIIEC
jgi:hypothetical protein